MALVNCPKCGKEVSSKAALCPNCKSPISVCLECGAPILSHDKVCIKCGCPTKRKANTNKSVIVVIVLFIIALIVCAAVFVPRIIEKQEQEKIRQEQERIYLAAFDEAKALCDAGKYEAAYNALQEIKEYPAAAELLTHIWFAPVSYTEKDNTYPYIFTYEFSEEGLLSKINSYEDNPEHGDSSTDYLVDENGLIYKIQDVMYLGNESYTYTLCDYMYDEHGGVTEINCEVYDGNDKHSNSVTLTIRNGKAERYKTEQFWEFESFTANGYTVNYYDHPVDSKESLLKRTYSDNETIIDYSFGVGERQIDILYDYLYFEESVDLSAAKILLDDFFFVY